MGGKCEGWQQLGGRDDESLHKFAGQAASGVSKLKRDAGRKSTYSSSKGAPTNISNFEIFQ